MSIFRRREPATIGQHRGFTTTSLGTSGATISDSLVAPMRLIPFYSGVTMITDSVSTAPLRGYQGEGATKMPCPVQPPLLADPGPFGLSVIAWLGQAAMSLLLRGNAYGLIIGTDLRGYATKVVWLNPDAVTVDESGAAPEYYVGGRHVDRPAMIHITGYAPPGTICGLSVVSLFRSQMETGLRAGELARKWYAEGAAPSAILFEKNRPLVSGEAAAAKALFKEAVRDRDILVTGNDWGYLPLSISPADAMFLEQSKATATECAAMLHLAPEDIGGQSGSSMTYATLESNDLRYIRRAVLPWVLRIEAALNRVLPEGVYAKFNLDALVRTELASRIAAHAVALDNGILTLDEVRALEDRAPLTPAQHDAWQADYVVPRPPVLVQKGPS